MDALSKSLWDRFWERWIEPWWPDPPELIMKLFSSISRLFRG
jgi:hypothetical protein